MSFARINCPVCDWHYDVPELDPRAVDPMALANVFGPGVFAQHALNSRAQLTERQLEAHFKTHTTAEWLAKVSALKHELQTLKANFP